MSRNLSLTDIEKVMLDAGVVYYKYASGAETLLAPTRGGNSFVVTREIKEITRDGAKGKEKGLRRIVTENAVLTVNVLGMTQDNIKLSLPGTSVDGVTGSITNADGGAGVIADGEYLEYVVFFGETLDGNLKEIYLYNALGDNGLSISTTDADESVMSIEFSAHYNPADLTEPIYQISDATEITLLGSISGVVVDSSGPVENVTVRALISGEIIGSALTDENGFYEVLGLEADTYDMAFLKEGYVNGSLSGIVVTASTENDGNHVVLVGA